MKVFLRMLSLLLACLFCVTLIVACNDGNDGDGDGDDGLIDSNYDINGRLKDNLPAELNFEGEEITMLYWSDVENPEFEQDTITGDNVRDAIYDRNNQIQDRMNVDINWIGIPGDGGERNNFVKQVEAVYLADEQTYDLIASYARTQGSLAIQGFLYNLATIENSYLDLDMPWWPQQLVETVSFGSAYYFISGDMSTNVLYMMHMFYLNKNLFSKFQLDLPYQDVYNGTWTLDKMIELTTGIYEDYDNDNKVSDGDQFGFIGLHYIVDSFYPGSNLRLVDEDETKVLVLSPDYGSHKTVKLINKLGNWAATSDVRIHSTFSEPFETRATVQNIFKTGRALMSIQHAGTGAGYANVEFDTGLVPVPKYDEKQLNYYTGMGNPWSIYGIFVDFDHRDDKAATLTMLTAVMECWASEGYRLTTPEIFEVNMQLKYSEGQDETNMFEYIRSGITFDLGKIFAGDLNNMCEIPSNAIYANSSWSASYGAYKRSLTVKIEQIVDNFLDYQAQRDNITK